MAVKARSVRGEAIGPRYLASNVDKADLIVYLLSETNCLAVLQTEEPISFMVSRKSSSNRETAISYCD
jgi:hypothetical protein